MPIVLQILQFVVSAIAVLIAGTRLSRYAEAIADRTGIGKALVGALFLGGVTSLPELAATLTAALIDNPSLAVNNLLGGVTMQVAILAIADAARRRVVLSSEAKGVIVIRQGAFLVALLLIAGAGILLGDLDLFGVGGWSILILVVAVGAFWWSRGEDEAVAAEGGDASDHPVSSLALKAIVASAVILLAGYALAQAADALAVSTGLGSTFVGAVLLAVATSLPEVATTLGAVAAGQVTMAVSNIFGTNVLDMAGIFLADLIASGGPILPQVTSSSLVVVVLGSSLTLIYILGLRWKRVPSVAGLGLDSWLVALLYLGGVGVLYMVR